LDIYKRGLWLRGGGWGPVKRVYFFARLGLSVGVLVAVAVSRRLTSFSVMAPLPARATRAFSNNWLLFRTSEKGCRAPRADAHYFVIGEADGG
jgi:hypothetical protein